MPPQREKQRMFSLSVLPFSSFGCPTWYRIAFCNWDFSKCTCIPSQRYLDFSGPLASLVDVAEILWLCVKIPQCIREEVKLLSYLLSHKA